MNVSKKMIAGITSAAMCISLAACGDSGSAGSDTPPNDTAAAPAVSENNVSVTDQAVPTEPVDLEAGLTDAMYERAILNEGNRSRLANVMKRAENGEDITVGVIGGSITQGSSASNTANSYAELFHRYWTEKFPDSNISFVNAGIGGTDSYLGVFRADEQLLSYEPDVVIVEFSVNDTEMLVHRNSYDSLVRKILKSERSPAVMLLFTTQENGTSLQDVHREIGEAYDLPMLSYREAVYPEVAAGTLDWKSISPDNIHPNDVGHSFIGQLISRYLDSVYDDLGNIDSEAIEFTDEPLTSDLYANARMLGASEITPLEISGFELAGNNIYPELFPDNFVTVDEGYLKFEIECRCLGIFYLKQTNGKGGKYEVYVDGERKANIDADFSGGWGNYGDTARAITSKETGTHTIEIKLAEGSENTELTIFGIMQS